MARSDRDLALAGCKRSWTWEVKEGLESMGAGGEATKLMNMQAVECKDVMMAVMDQHQAFWGQFAGVETRKDEVLMRKSLTYEKLFKLDRTPQIPKYFSAPEVSYDDAIRVARFRLSSHFLGVEKGRFFEGSVEAA